MKSVFYSIILIVSFSFPSLLAQEVDARGLMFKPGPSAFELTAALLNNGNPIELPGNFTLSFDFSFWYLAYWGQIVSLYSDEGIYALAKFNHFSSKENYLIQFYVNGNEIPVDITIPKLGYYPYKWGSIEIRANDAHTQIDIFYNQSFIGTLHPASPLPDQLKIGFGAVREQPQSGLKETPAMVLRDIVISKDDDVIHRWNLNPQKKDFTLDSENDMPILINNPDWLIDAHYRWKLATHYNPADLPGFTDDPSSNRVFLGYRESLRILNLQSGEDTVIFYENPRPREAAYLVYNNDKNLIYSTHFGRWFVTTFDFKTRRWAEYDSTDVDNLQHYGHNLWYDGLTKNLYSFGGYGWFTTKNSISRYDFIKKEWIPLFYHNEGITPRHFTAFGKGFNEHEYLFFSGVGNESGKQEQNFKLYSDLYSFSLKDTIMRKITTFEVQGLPCYFGFNLILFPSDSSFFTLREKENPDSSDWSLSLFRWSIPNRSYTKFAEAIPFIKNKDTFSKLYYVTQSKSFYFFLWSGEDRKLKLYTLLYPPVESDPLIQKPAAAFSFLTLVLAAGIGIVLVFIVIWIKRSKSTWNNGASAEVATLFDTIEPVDAKIVTEFFYESSPEPDRSSRSTVIFKNCLILFGGFSLYDHAGENVADQFSARIKEVFLLIAIRSFVSTQNLGITSEELSSIIWPDNSYESAKSNRNVSINKIRKIIEPVRGLKLEYSAKIWKLTLDNEFYCDFANFHSIINGNGFEPQIKTGESELFLSIVENGELLSGVSYPWLDSYKATLNSEIIATLKKQFETVLKTGEPEKAIRICNSILKIDPVDEETFLKKMEALVSEGQSGAAKSCFEQFILEYKRLYAEDYRHSFQEIAERFRKS